MKKLLVIFAIFIVALKVSAQSDRWQQRVKYTMNVDADVNSNRFKGKETLEYTNNSPDILKKVFIHLYWNAFQPNSMMDVRSREQGKLNIGNKPDWNPLIADRISKLEDSQIGYQKIISLKMNGVPQPFKYHETILEVDLTSSIQGKSKTLFDIEFEAQVPIQIRRSGRDNAEGIRYSMSQWYPKMCEYDYEGWHPTPYVAREFYGVWGDYDVTINIDKNYKLGATGVLQNAVAIGWGYDQPGTELKSVTGTKRSWHFIGENIHDFVWAADPTYSHLVRKVNNTTIHVIYKKVDSLEKKWETVANAAVMVLPYMEKHFGNYPYPQYSFIQGGDGGMEYPMATLIKGPGLGTVFHEWMHTWYQMMLGSNESLYPWMDEGFTSFAEGEITAHYDSITNAPPKKNEKELPLHHSNSYKGYFQMVKLDLQEPLTTHSDHYNTNYTYNTNAYSKGAIFLEQLGYIVGENNLDKILLEYYKLWRFKHPNPNDFVKVAQDVSGIQLDWYKEYWVNTTKTIDYSIDSLWEENGTSKIRLKRIGEMPMPIDLELRFKDGTKELHNIPLNLMFGNKTAENAVPTTFHDEWKWTNPTYVLEFKRRLSDLKEVEIDPSQRMADINRKNNLLQLNW